MRDEDIKKALECCGYGVTKCVCNECPIRYRESCLDDLPKIALALIIRLQAEIERLQKELASKCLEYSLLEREKVEDILVFADDLKRVKSEAIKDCVNKYTEMLIDEYHLRTDLQIESIKRLEQKVLTEMVGGENEENN